MLLTMSDVERGIYDNCRTELEKRQMCCHLQVVERLQKVIGNDMLTLNQVKDVMIDHTNQVSCQLSVHFWADFYCHLTRCIGVAFAMATWLSVCLSRWFIVPKRLSWSSCNFHQIVAHHSSFPMPNVNLTARGDPKWETSGKSRKTRPINPLLTRGKLLTAERGKLHFVAFCVKEMLTSSCAGVVWFVSDSSAFCSALMISMRCSSCVAGNRYCL